MKKIILLVIVIIALSMSSFAAEDSPTTFRVKYGDGSIATTEAVLTKDNWVSVVTDDTVVATSAVLKIKPETSEKDMGILLRTALSQVQKMRESVKSYGLIVESFSVNIGVPPSVTVNFKFKDTE